MARKRVSSNEFDDVLFAFLELLAGLEGDTDNAEKIRNVLWLGVRNARAALLRESAATDEFPADLDH